MSFLWLGLTAAVFGASVFMHWPITAFLDGIVPRIGFATYQLTAAAPCGSSPHNKGRELVDVPAVR